MKILLVSEYFPPKIFGGGEISAALLAKNLSREGIEVSVLTSHFNGLEKFEVKDGVKIYRRLKTGENPNSFFSNFKRAFLFPYSTKRELIKLNKKENFDIIHCMNINSIIGAAKAKKEIKKPIIAHVNSPVLFCPIGTLMKGKKNCKEKCSFFNFLGCFFKEGKISKIQNKYLQYNPLFAFYVYFRFKRRKSFLRKVDFFLPISNFMKNLLIRGGIPREKIAVVPNPVELEKFLKLESKWHKPVKILYLGNYEKFKGPQILLQGLKEIKLEYEANFYGSGSLEKWMKNFVKENNLSGKIKINRKVSYDEIPRLYQEHDILVFPSLIGEAFGRIVIEAMAAGNPVIASRIGGVVDIVGDRKTGFLVEAGNVDELRNAIIKLIDKPELREKMGAEGRIVAKERYVGKRIAGKVIKVYENVIDGRDVAKPK